MLSDYTELLSILNAHRVRYLVVGAYAVAIHMMSFVYGYLAIKGAEYFPGSFTLVRSG